MSIRLMAGQTANFAGTLWVDRFRVDQVNRGQSFANWTLLDDHGTLLGQGQCELAELRQVGVRARITINGALTIPEGMAPTIEGQGLTLLCPITLALTTGADPRVVEYQEDVEVAPDVTANMGAQDSLELFGDTAQLVLFTSHVPDDGSVTASLVTDPRVNARTTLTPVGDAELTPLGWKTLCELNTSELPFVPPDPIMVNWRYSVGGAPQLEMSRLYVVNERQVMAIQNLRQYVQQAVLATDPGPADMTMPPSELMGWLLQGRAAFNSFGHPTAFTFVNASDTMMYYWVMFSAIVALRSQFLRESLRSFDYTGAQVSLNVDYAQAFDGLASSLEQSLTEQCRQFKAVLSKRGLTRGDGNFTGLEVMPGALGTVGLSLSPVLNFRGFANGAGQWLGLNVRMF